MSPRTRVILLVGGVLHGMLVYAAVLGILYSGVALYAARANQIAGQASNPVSPYALSLVAMLIVAGLFGWFCMRLAAVAQPWRVELSALGITIPVGLLIALVVFLAVSLARVDQAAWYLWYISLGVSVVLSGAITFYMLGRRHDSRRVSSESEQNATV